MLFAVFLHALSLSTTVVVADVIQIPKVSLLSDASDFDRSQDVRSLLALVSQRKQSPFKFGVAYDPGNSEDDEFGRTLLASTFNHGVSENRCKWNSMEPTQGVIDATGCLGSQQFFEAGNATFKFHAGFWHKQLPNWLPGDFTSDELVNDTIPEHIQIELAAMDEKYTAVDVLNELVGDGISAGSSAFDCVSQKQVWPTTISDSDATPFLNDLQFIEIALTAARASTNATLLLNDYNIGGDTPKTACYLTLVTQLQAHNIPINALGFQSHVGAKLDKFDSKSTLKSTFGKFGALGVDVSITELDVWVQDSSEASQRWQAAIYGDYIDACLYSSNCLEVLVWGLHDGISWLNHLPNTGIRKGLLFDEQREKKMAWFEVMARLERYAQGGEEVCETASGIEVCDVTTEAARLPATAAEKMLRWPGSETLV